MRGFRPFVLWIALTGTGLAFTSDAWAERPNAAPRGAANLPARNPNARPSAPPSAQRVPGARPAATPSRPTAAPSRTAATPSRPAATPSRPAATPSRPAATPSRSSAVPSRTAVSPARSDAHPSAASARTAARTAVNVPHRAYRPTSAPHRADARVPASRRNDYVPLHRRASDHRYARPDHRAVYERHAHHPRAHYAAPRRVGYTPYYTRWWVHPYWRYQYATTSVVVFDFYCDPWYDTWAPPYRPGWTWVPGYWSWGTWYPGYWAPTQHSPYFGYTYVPGFWVGAAYVEGYYRPESRPSEIDDDGWEWVDGYYLDDGTYVWGYWAPTEPPPEGYTWEPGFYDGETYVDGFWRPEYREGYTWVAAYYDEDGVFQTGYWAPAEDQPGQVWVPGWFDGNEWQDGYWVDDADFNAAEPEAWEPEAGWDAGWEVGAGWGAGAVIENQTRDTTDVDPDEAPVRTHDGVEELPLAIPAEP